jgi:enediyne biosynthesis protein E7
MATNTSGLIGVTESGVPAEPPGPHGVAAARAWLMFARDPWHYPSRLIREYGDVVSLPIPTTDIVLLGALEHINHVAVTNAENYRRSDWVAAEMKPVEHSFRFFAFDESDWDRGRRLMKPHFSKRSLLGLENLFDVAISDQLDRWEPLAGSDEVVDLQPRMKALTLAVLFNALFSQRLTQPRLHWLTDRLTDVMAATTVRTLGWSLPSAIPRPLAKRGIKAQREIDVYLSEIVAERRRNPDAECDDVLNVLVNACYDDGRALEDDKILTEMLGLVIGGFDTTSAALTWTFGLIASHPQVEQELLAELATLGGDSLAPSETNSLSYTRACFDEAQRLQGGLVINPKVAVADDTIGGFRIKAGTTVVSSNVAIHRDPRYWDQPDLFDPDRWLNRSVRRDAYLPFGRGSRLCLGMHMAYIEATHTIAKAFSRYRFEMATAAPIRPKYRMAVEVRGGLPVRIHRT